jgi:hypothetical protein
MLVYHDADFHLLFHFQMHPLILSKLIAPKQGFSYSKLELTFIQHHNGAPVLINQSIDHIEKYYSLNDCLPFRPHPKPSKILPAFNPVKIVDGCSQARPNQ